MLGLVFLVYRYTLYTVSPIEKTLWIVDTSLSMAVEDIPGSDASVSRLSRLGVAQSLLKKGLSNISGEHAIISYARDATLESPFTTDTTHLQHIVSSLRVRDQFGGSDLSAPLLLMKMLYGGSDERMRVYWILDGGILPGELVELSEGWELTLIGIGSDVGAKIPLGYTIDGERRYRTYSGVEVVSRYEADVIDALASEYGASRIRIEHDGGLPDTLMTTSTHSLDGRILLLFASVFLIFGYFYHPYAPSR